MAGAAHRWDSVDLLTAFDQAIGDGDHGVGMRRGFTAVLEQLETQPQSVEAAFKVAGMAIHVAGRRRPAGAVFGTLFRSGQCRVCRARTVFDAQGFCLFPPARLYRRWSSAGGSCDRV